MISRYVYFAAILLFLYEVFSLLPTEPPVPSVSTPWIKGYFSVHTRERQGAGTKAEALRAARARAADFIIFNDAAETPEKIAPDGEKPIYVFSETEVVTPSGHLTVFHSHTSAAELNQKAVANLGYEHFLGTTKIPGLFASVSHPSHRLTPWTQLDRFPDGIEIVNFDSQFQRQIAENPFSTTSTIALAPLNAFLAAARFQQVYPKDLSSWDDMNAVSPGHFGLLASDLAPLAGTQTLHWTWPDYRSIFALGSNRIFLGAPLAEDAKSAQLQIYQAIQKGRLALAFDNVYDFSGNDFFLQCGANEFRPGDRILPPGRCEFIVRFPESLPYRRVVKLIKDGEVESQLTTADSKISLPLGLPGTYRVEVWAELATQFGFLLHREVPYVFYNPVYVR